MFYLWYIFHSYQYVFFFSLTLIETLSLHYFIRFHALSPQPYQAPVANLFQHAAIFLGPVHLSQSSFATATCFFWSITVMLGTLKYVIAFVQSCIVKLIRSHVPLFYIFCSSCVEDDVLLSFLWLSLCYQYAVILQWFEKLAT